MNRDGDDVALTSSFRMAFLVLVAMVGVFAQGKGDSDAENRLPRSKGNFPSHLNALNA